MGPRADDVMATIYKFHPNAPANPCEWDTEGARQGRQADPEAAVTETTRCRQGTCERHREELGLPHHRGERRHPKGRQARRTFLVRERTSAMMPGVFEWCSVTIGSVHIEVNEDDSVSFTDTRDTNHPPVVLYRMAKARGIVAMLLRAVKKLPKTDGISWVDQRQHDASRSGKRTLASDSASTLNEIAP